MEDQNQIVDELILEIDPKPWVDVAKLRTALLAFFDDNAGKSPEQLAEIVGCIDDGGSVHTRGWIIQHIRARVLFPCPQLTAAAIYDTWKGGKVGFQFLPDPGTTAPVDYHDAVEGVCDAFEPWNSVDQWNPRNVLTGEDRQFFDTLPDRLTIYRGGNSRVSHEVLAQGLCWTTRRNIAEWFALRSEHWGSEPMEPILVSARIPKDAIYVAFASEYEVVARPWRWRTLKCRIRNLGNDKPWQPNMQWQPPMASPEMTR